MNYRILEKLVKERNLSIEKFAALIDLSAGGWDYMIKNESCTVKRLEEIAKVLKVPIQTFFDENYKIEQKGIKENESDSLYIKGYVDALLAENKELKEKNEKQNYEWL